MLTIRVLDGNGEGLHDAMIEIWQANSEGKYNHPDDQQAEDRRSRLSRLRTRRYRGGWKLRIRNHQARTRAGPGKCSAGAASERGRVRARHAEATLHTNLFCRRSWQTRKIRFWRWCRRSAVRLSWRIRMPLAPAAGVSIFVCRAKVRLCSSTSDAAASVALSFPNSSLEC